MSDTQYGTTAKYGLCPSCGGELGWSEHAYFQFDVIAVRCHPCSLMSIVGADRWIRFPRWTGRRAVVLGIPDSLSDEEANQLKEFDAANQKARKELDALAKAVHDKNARPKLIPVETPPDSPCDVYGVELAVSIEALYQRSLKWIEDWSDSHPADYQIPVILGMTPTDPKQETWRDRKPLL